MANLVNSPGQRSPKAARSQSLPGHAIPRTSWRVDPSSNLASSAATTRGPGLAPAKPEHMSLNMSGDDWLCWLHKEGGMKRRGGSSVSPQGKLVLAVPPDDRQKTDISPRTIAPLAPCLPQFSGKRASLGCQGSLTKDTDGPRQYAFTNDK